VGWKNWSAWLKGGIIGLIIWIIFFILAGIVDFQIKGIIPPLIIGNLHSNLTIPFVFAENVIIYVIISAIIGLIVGKVKSKRT